MINNTIHFSAAWIAPYVILDTDYENFSCIYSCSGYNFGYYSDFAFIFSRSPTLADRYYRRCEAAFMNIGVEPSRFSKTTQGSSCPTAAIGLGKMSVNCPYMDRYHMPRNKINY
ncbi:crustacyanin subunit C [Penaeus vannamei]|uniref:Crustacyanin subunit C n=1 Tax=Penaeus vannamei TaxID=6689 RepID=A0A3R7NNR5_PENVA|nr:crustacyanin subunit C [Penaeus vannamei]